MVLVCIPLIIFVERAQRRIPVNYAKRVQGRKMMGGQSTYIPLKVNAAGVIPIIFASCLIYFPAQLAALFNVDWLTTVANWMLHRLAELAAHRCSSSCSSRTSTPPWCSIRRRRRTTCASRAASFPACVRARPRCSYIKNVLQPRDAARRHLHRRRSRLCRPSSSTSPATTLIQAFGGTSILIMIGVALDTMSKVESQLKMYNYEGFFK